MNELDLLLLTIVELACLFFATALGREYLYASITANLLLIGFMGAKVISVFGLVTNVGNIFYAAVFIATYLLLERDAKRERGLIVGVGLAAVVFVAIMAKLTVELVTVPATADISAALATVFDASWRIIFASLTSYLIAQSINFMIYLWLRERQPQALALRVASAAFVAQAIDSALFFTIAFVGVLPLSQAMQGMMVGFVLKVVVILLSIPLLSVCRDKHCN